MCNPVRNVLCFPLRHQLAQKQDRLGFKNRVGLWQPEPGLPTPPRFEAF